MNQRQVLLQLKKLLQARKIQNNAALNLAFSEVVISDASAIELLSSSDIQMPFAKLTAGNVSWDGKVAGFSRDMGYEVTVVLEVEGDEKGEFVLIGGALPAGVIGSMGRGILELGEEVRETLKLLDPRFGVSLQLITDGQLQSAPIEETRWLAERTYTFKGRGTSEAFYYGSRRFKHAGAGVFTWELPPSQFGFVGMILRRAVGSVAPATISDGTGVVIANPLTDVTVTDTPGAGTFSYSLFGGYNERETLPADRSSRAAAIEGIPL